MESLAALKDFHPIVRRWFERVYREPSPPQALGWPSISSGKNTLILAPTGSGKTMAAFLWAINHLVEQHLAEDLPAGVRILYISPLKALNNDIERNLVAPLKGISDEAAIDGLRLRTIRTAVRTGDTPQSKRTALIKHPPDILITTPESLYLLLTSRDARRTLRTIQYVIVDEIHSLCGNKRGVHLSLSLERLQAIADQEFVRIGLSATQRPLETIAAFLGGYYREGRKLVPRDVAIVDAGRRREMNLRVVSPVPDFSLVSPDGVWPGVLDHLLELIRSHLTTLVFVNNRRLAERLATRLNERMNDGTEGWQDRRSSYNLYAVPVRTAPAPETPLPLLPIVQAYHGSMSRVARETMEQDLKAGKLRALVATSSLELGIDIGSIDLVIQVQSPKGIARGLQRVGRSGHLVNATSMGRILPTHREDLVESAVVARAMAGHDVETTTIPADCLDVLAQQIVAMVSVEDWQVDQLHDLVRQSYCYRSLSRNHLSGVLQMLGGRYTDETFRELKARISWDKVNGVLRALPGSKQLAVTGGGTIADRGAYRVLLNDGKTKVGEVDEEFVYESRVGDTFVLGSNTWRMTAIDGNTVSVAPAPGEPARMPFWKGEGIGRSFELGSMMGAFRREMNERLPSADCFAWLQHEFPVDRDAAWNIQEYFRRQHEVTGMIPHDRLLVIESFRDEIGDPRIVVHSTYGRRFNGLLGIYLLRRLQESSGIEPQMLYNDDGVLLRSSDAVELATDLFDGITVRGAEQIVLDGLLSSPLFGAQFRQNASRALLLPKLHPGKRTPLWLQRLRAGDLLQVARKYEDFPIVMETMREVLNDILDFHHFKQVVAEIESGVIQVAATTTEVPSPFASSLLFDFISAYMYEGDQPRDDRTSQSVRVNRELLAEIVDVEALPSSVSQETVRSVEGQLQHITAGTRARSPEELMEILLRIGDLSDDELLARCEGNGRDMLDVLKRDHRAIAVHFPNGDRWVAGEDRQLYQDSGDLDSMDNVFRRYMQGHGPVAAMDLAKRYGLSKVQAQTILDRLTSDSSIVRGRFMSQREPEAADFQWCYRPNLERIHRHSVTALRREIVPCTLEEFTNFLLHWHHLHPSTQLHGPSALHEIVGQLHAFPAFQDIWEREIFMRRISDYAPGTISELSASGSVIWQGTAGGRIRPLFRGEARSFNAAPWTGSGERVEPARRIITYLQQHGASFFNDIRSGTRLSLDGVNKGIADLFWGGEITNDVFAEVLNVKRYQHADDRLVLERIEIVNPRHNPMRVHILGTARRALRQVPGWAGRWSVVRDSAVLGPEVSPEEQIARQASQLLARYGIVAREFHAREDLLPWPQMLHHLQHLELRGEIRRGYFVHGLSGMQFALPAAVDLLKRLHASPPGNSAPVLVHAGDPANPFGPGMNLPAADGRETPLRVNRLPGSWLAFIDGRLILLIEGNGARLWTFAEPDEVRPALQAFVQFFRLPEPLRPFREIRMEQINGSRPGENPLAPFLRSLGFERGADQTLRLDSYGLRDPTR